MHFRLSVWGAGGVGPNWSVADNQLIMYECDDEVALPNAFDVCWILCKRKKINLMTSAKIEIRFDSVAIDVVVVCSQMDW